MPLAVLITQCLQNDFVAPIPPNEPLPNQLHVGSSESRRLLGEDPRTGAVAQLVAWARAQDPARFHVIHIRDWHDPADPKQADHLNKFGHHCVAGERGARFVLDLDDHLQDRPNEHIVDATGLNDFEDTRLPDVLAALRAGAPDGALRVGVVGVWTEAKITFLLYDLITRGGVALDHLATCYALTASSSRVRHMEALEQIRSVLGVTVHPTLGELERWLLEDGAQAPLPDPPGTVSPPIRLPEGSALGATDRSLVGLLYRDAAHVELDPLSGGFSGALVFRAASADVHGTRQAPSVLKLGPSDKLGEERMRFEKVEAVLGNAAPSVRGFAHLGDRAAIKFSYAGMGQGAVRTFKSLYEGGAPQGEIDRILGTVFDEVLAPFFAAAQYESLNLLEAYGFKPDWAPGVSARVDAIAGSGAGAADTLTFPGGVALPNVARFYDGFLPLGVGFHADERLVGYVHGDLNGANILLDGRDNVWLIDFAHTQRGHFLQDLAKLENDLLFIYTKLADEAELAAAIALTQGLRGVKDLRAPLPEEPPAGSDVPALRRAWATLRTLRRLVGRKCRDDHGPLPLSIALLRYAAHTLDFKESVGHQKRWALAAACGHAEDVRATLLANRALRVDVVDPAAVALPGRLGMTICPGRSDRRRNLAEDLDALLAWGAATLVSLVTERELDRVGVPHLGEAARERGLRHVLAPIPDQGAPTLAEAQALVGHIRGELAAGRSVVVHCMGGLGRTGTVAACCLIAGGMAPDEAVATVRRARDPRAVESPAQARFVAEFAAARA